MCSGLDVAVLIGWLCVVTFLSVWYSRCRNDQIKMVLLLVAYWCSLRAGSVVLAIFPWLQDFNLSQAKIYFRLIHASSRGLSFLGVTSCSLLGCYSGRVEWIKFRVWAVRLWTMVEIVVMSSSFQYSVKYGSDESFPGVKFFEWGHSDFYTGCVPNVRVCPGLEVMSKPQGMLFGGDIWRIDPVFDVGSFFSLECFTAICFLYSR